MLPTDPPAAGPPREVSPGALPVYATIEVSAGWSIGPAVGPAVGRSVTPALHTATAGTVPTTTDVPGPPPAAAPKIQTITGYAAVFYVPGDPRTVGVADDGAELRYL